MLNRNNFAIASCADKEEQSRYAINNVRVYPDRTEATNGHYAVIMSGVGDPATFDPFHLPAKTALDITKALPKKGEVSPAIARTNNVVELSWDHTTKKVDVDPDLAWPNIDMIKKDPASATVRICFNPNYLMELLRVLAPLCDAEHGVILSVYDKDTQARFDAGHDGQVAEAYLMPMHLES